MNPIEDPSPPYWRMHSVGSNLSTPWARYDHCHIWIKMQLEGVYYVCVDDPINFISKLIAYVHSTPLCPSCHLYVYEDLTHAYKSHPWIVSEMDAIHADTSQIKPSLIPKQQQHRKDRPYQIYTSSNEKEGCLFPSPILPYLPESDLSDTIQFGNWWSCIFPKRSIPLVPLLSQRVGLVLGFLVEIVRVFYLCRMDHRL